MTLLAPVELVVLQGTSFCNLNCTYCDLSSASRRSSKVMPFAVIDRLFTALLEGNRLAPDVTVVWHSGEPLSLEPAYYDTAIEFIRQKLGRAAGPEPVNLRFDIQTNGVFINEEWCAFFRRHAAYLDVGISCDGPTRMHDAYRVNWGRRPSHAHTLRGMDLLERQGVKYRVIAVVSGHTLADAEGFFDFFHHRRAALSGFRFNILVSGSATADPMLSFNTTDRARYYEFYRRLLDLSRAAQEAGGGLAIRNFTYALTRILAGRDEGQVSYTEETSAPLRSLSMDADGNITTFYAGLAPDAHRDQYGDGRGLCLGNVLETPLEDMLKAPKLKAMMADFSRSRQACATRCPYFAVCPGGYELTKLAVHATFDSTETPECVIHVQALTDALLDDIAAHLARAEPVVEAV